jgi:protein required for attachment to host cells
MTTWLVAADRTGARVYQRVGSTLNRIHDLEHAEGRVRDQDLEAGRPARTFDRHGQGRAATDRGRGPHERAAHDLARQVAAFLEEGRQRKGVTEAVLVAEPHLLGILRADIPETSLVVRSIAKDLHGVSDSDMPDRLAELLTG